MADALKRPYWDGQKLWKRGEVIGVSQAAEEPVVEVTDEKPVAEKKTEKK